MDRCPEPLAQQHLRANRKFNRRAAYGILSEREREILQLVACDLTDREIAEQLRLSIRTVNTHLGHIYRKLGVKGRASAAITGIFAGIINPPS